MKTFLANGGATPPFQNPPLDVHRSRGSLPALVQSSTIHPTQPASLMPWLVSLADPDSSGGIRVGGDYP